MVGRRTADEDDPLYLGWLDCLRVLRPIEWADQETFLAVPLRFYDIPFETCDI